MSYWVGQHNLSGKQTKSVDGKDLGKVQEVADNYILTEGESKFYIPTYLIEKYDADVLWFKINEDEAKSKFIIAKEPRPILSRRE
jgi:hypothetical protein